MALIERFLFIALNGEPPATLGLRPLTTFKASFATVRQALSPYMAADGPAHYITDLTQFEDVKPTEGLTVAYLMGHAWLEHATYHTAMRRHGVTDILRDAGLRTVLRAAIGDGPVLLLVDTCHAAAFRQTAEEWPSTSRVTVFASPADDTALEFPLDGATRFSLLLGTSLANFHARNDLDVLELILRMRDDGARMDVLAPQHITYAVRGTPPTLTRPHAAIPTRFRRQRTVSIIRLFLIAVGAIMTLAALAAAVYAYNYALLEVAIGDVSHLARDLTLEFRLERPAANESSLLTRQTVPNAGVVRLHVPADNIVVVVDGLYNDGAPRAIRFHLVLTPTFRWSAKFIRVNLPSAADVAKHPRMAYVPRTPWWQGGEKERAENSSAFWIDLWPVTVEEYLPLVQRWLEDDRLPPEGSVLPVVARNRAAVNAVGLKQLPTLTTDIGKIFDVLRAEQRPLTRRGKEKEVPDVPRLELPCPRCPAPLNRSEALLYCGSRGLRIPTARQWELAARGVDGRVYPWGDKFDRTRANIIGLPEKGEAFILKPVDAFPDGRSPFGVFDTVGNAGDWVDTEGGYESTFMGGEFRFNWQDATVYAQTPSTQVPPLYSVTTRCVDS